VTSRTSRTTHVRRRRVLASECAPTPACSWLVWAAVLLADSMEVRGCHAVVCAFI
jgi:hypothetical protein